MSTDFRALCAELADKVEYWVAYGEHFADETDIADAHSLVDRARAALAQPIPAAEREVAEHVRWLDFESERALKAGRYFPAEMLGTDPAWRLAQEPSTAP